MSSQLSNEKRKHSRLPAKLISRTWVGWKIRIEIWTLIRDFTEIMEG